MEEKGDLRADTWCLLTYLKGRGLLGVNQPCLERVMMNGGGGDPRLWLVGHCGGLVGGSDALTLIPLVPESYSHNLCVGRLTITPPKEVV